MYLNKWVYILGYGSKLELTRELVNGNGVITDLTFKPELQGEELKQLIMTAANRALEQANRTKEMEMAQAAKGMMPGF